MKPVTSFTLSHPLMHRRLFSLAVGLALALSLLAPLAGQAQAAKADDVVTIPVKLQYIHPRHLADTMRMLGIQFQQVVDLNTVIVTGDSREIKAARELIAALDVPPEPARSVEVNVYLLAATRAQSGNSDLPDLLQPAVRNLEESLGYRGFSLIDTLYLRTKDGSNGGVSGGGRQLVEEGHTVSTLYEFGFDRLSILDRQEVRVVRFDDLWFETGMDSSGPSQFYASALRTDIELLNGQVAVIAKATPAGTDHALVLVVSAEIVD